MAAIAAARDLPPDELPAATPRDEDDPPIPLLTGFMQVVLGDLCTRSMLSSGLVATSSDLRQLVRSTLENRPLPEGLLLNTGWRKSAVLPELVAVLLGHKRVRVRSSGQASPLEYSD
jgi:ribonuclease D